MTEWYEFEEDRLSRLRGMIGIIQPSKLTTMPTGFCKEAGNHNALIDIAREVEQLLDQKVNISA